MIDAAGTVIWAGIGNTKIARIVWEKSGADPKRVPLHCSEEAVDAD